jgi:hypothetical protein
LTPLEDAIRSRGHWWIVIHPADYVEKRVEMDRLEPILRRSVVQLRGWDFPHFSDRDPIAWRMKSIAGKTEWQYYREVLRFYCSGQFSYLGGIHEDWFDQVEFPRWGPPAALRERGSLLGVGDALFRMTEVFEFASRLAVTPAGGDAMNIKVEVHNLRDRMLWVDSPNRFPMDHEYRADIESYISEDQFAASQLAAGARPLAANWTLELLRRFGFKPPLSMLLDQQNELRHQ